MQTFINVCLRKMFKYFGVMLCQTKKCGGITEEGFLCHKDTSFALEEEEK